MTLNVPSLTRPPSNSYRYPTCLLVHILSCITTIKLLTYSYTKLLTYSSETSLPNLSKWHYWSPTCSAKPLIPQIFFCPRVKARPTWLHLQIIPNQTIPTDFHTTSLVQATISVGLLLPASLGAGSPLSSNLVYLPPSN